MMKASLNRIAEIETDIRDLLAQITYLSVSRRTSENINKLHQTRIKLAEVCAAYDMEFSDFQLYVDVSVHPADRLKVRNQHYRAQAINEPGCSRQSRMEI